MEYFLKCGEQYAIDAETAKGRTMLTREEADSLLDESKNALVEMLCNMSHQIDMLNDKLKANDEAISELEETMKPKACDACRHLFFDAADDVYKCINGVSDDAGYLDGEAVIRNIKDFYCVQYR